jgi:hypothetical protein
MSNGSICAPYRVCPAELLTGALVISLCFTNLFFGSSTGLRFGSRSE